MKKYVMGIDSGSQSTKVGIYDLLGTEVAFGSYPLKEYHIPKPGMVVHPDEDIWDSVKGAIGSCLNHFKGDTADILAVGLCTIRFCRVLLKKDGTLAAPVISWMDERMNKPYEHTNPDVAYVTSTAGYISNRLTGEFTDAASMLEAGWPMDLSTLEWSTDDEVVKSCGLQREQLFTLIKPGERLGNLRQSLAKEFGLPEDLPIVASANDKAVEVLGSGINKEGSVMISLGTFISAMLYSETAYEKSATHFWSTLACIPFKHVFESNGIRRGMWTVSWLKSILGSEIAILSEQLGLSAEDYLNEQAKRVPPGSDGLITILDWLAEPNEPYRKGIMIGFDQRHTKFHIYRSIIEAIGFAVKNNVMRMTEEIGIQINEIIAIGGGSNSDLLMQVLADQFNLPVIRKEGSSSGALGAAICALVYKEVYDFDTAVGLMVRTKKTFKPDVATHHLYEKMNNEVVTNVRKHTDEILKKTYSMFR